MSSLFSLIVIFSQINNSGYVETRPYLAWNNSTNLFGYNRGWIELKQDKENYGAQVALDCQVWYDSISFSSLIDNIDISRLALWLGKENRRVTIGKQRIYWGVARVFRPLDILNPANYFEPGYERAGTNAILGYFSFGNLSNLRAIVKPKFDIKQTLFGMRFGTNWLKNDIGLNVFHEQDNKMTIIGTEIIGEAEIGYWTELSYNWKNTDKYFKASVGIDYSFPFYIYTMLEYFYDQSGEVNANDYTKLITGERNTLGEQYLYASIGSVYNPYFRPAINVIINLNDKGFVIIPTIMYEIFENTEVNLGCNLFFGSQNSEFKNISPYNGQVYIWVKVYF